MKTERTRCWKITEKVSFNIASEASNVYNLSGQMLMKNAKIGFFENLKLPVKQRCQTGPQCLKITQNVAFEILAFPTNFCP